MVSRTDREGAKFGTRKPRPSDGPATDPDLLIEISGFATDSSLEYDAFLFRYWGLGGSKNIPSWIDFQ